MTAVAAWGALLVALAALGIAVAAIRQSGEGLTAIRQHRLAHSRAHGTEDPDRRKRTQGPPAGQPERRQDPPELAHQPIDQTQYVPVVSGRHGATAYRTPAVPPAPTRTATTPQPATRASDERRARRQDHP